MNSPRPWLVGRLRLLTLSASVAFVCAGCRVTDPTAPNGPRAEFDLNGAPFVTEASVLIDTTASSASTLALWAYRTDISIRILILYQGPGHYVLGPENVEVTLLVGGDVRTGVYAGSVTTPGALMITEAGAVGEPLRAAFFFDADHLSGEARFSATATFRNGELNAVLAARP